ncbi:hypothetical protein LCGC14_1142860 [marine sediment metagenome]|uniref:Uncharacterized protein n=1 Tax=marine sediment metagenome TaxID=412755 RepID=A0A0F9PFX8_9ZZZZ
MKSKTFGRRGCGGLVVPSIMIFAALLIKRDGIIGKQNSQ